MDSDTALRLFFTVGSGAMIGDFRFATDGNAVTTTMRNVSMYYVEISDIWGIFLEKPNTVSVNGIQITNVSALSSVFRTLGNSSSTEALKHAAMALYYYNQTVKAFFG